MKDFIHVPRLYQNLDLTKRSYLATCFLMKGVIFQLFIIFGCLTIGELFVHFTGINFPSSVIGMLLLTLLLELKIIRLEWVKGIADFLTGNLAFFFIPPGVAIMLYFDIIQAQFMPICLATIISTILVLCVTGWTHQFVRKKNLKKKENGISEK